MPQLPLDKQIEGVIRYMRCYIINMDKERNFMVIPKFTPISTLQRDYNAVVRKLDKGPVILSQYTKPVAVVMSPAQYEHLTGLEVELKRLQRIIQYDQDFAEMRQGKYTE